MMALVIALFILLLVGSLVTSGIAIASEARREKKEQMEKMLAEYRVDE